MSKKKVEIVNTPTGPKTGSAPLDGFQIVSLKEFHANKHLPTETKETHHQLSFDLIWICTKGSGVHFVDFEPYPYEEYGVFIIKKGQYHAWKVVPDLEGFLIFLTPDFYLKMGVEIQISILQESISALMPPYIQISDAIDQLGVVQLCHLMQKEYLLKKEQNSVLMAYLTAFLKKIEFEYLEKYSGMKRMVEGSLFIKFQKALEKNISISRNGKFYCDLLDVSFIDLNNKCKIVSGFTLKNYIDTYLITKAKKKLTNTENNISEIGLSLGFDEVGNFSKYFKKHTGVSPKQFMSTN
ncbi:MAG: helix-turn-helix domain-containing protein [Reichenbachiella sp.]